MRTSRRLLSKGRLTGPFFPRLQRAGFWKKVVCIPERPRTFFSFRGKGRLRAFERLVQAIRIFPPWDHRYPRERKFPQDHRGLFFLPLGGRAALFRRQQHRVSVRRRRGPGQVLSRPLFRAARLFPCFPGYNFGFFPCGCTRIKPPRGDEALIIGRSFLTGRLFSSLAQPHSLRLLLPMPLTFGGLAGFGDTISAFSFFLFSHQINT